MSQHISVRVPWHDHGWDGTVCAAPGSNTACLRLKTFQRTVTIQQKLLSAANAWLTMRMN